MRGGLALAVGALRRRDRRTPTYAGPWGLWKLVGLAVTAALLFGVEDLVTFGLLLAALVGWAAPLASARYAASAVAREREAGSLGVLVQAAGPGTVFLAAVGVGSLGPALEVTGTAALVSLAAVSPGPLALAALTLVLQVVAAGALGAWVGARSGGLRQALQFVALGSVSAYSLLFALAAFPDDPAWVVAAVPPLVIHAGAQGWDAAPTWGAASAVALGVTALAAWRFSRVRE